MYKFLTKNGQLIAFGLGLLITLIFLGVAFGGLDDFNALADDERNTSNLFNFGINAAVALAVICAIAMLVFGLLQIVTNFKSSTKGLIGLGIIVIIFLVGYFNADIANESGAVLNSIETMEVDNSSFKFISGGIITALVMSGLALLVFVVSEILNFFK